MILRHSPSSADRYPYPEPLMVLFTLVDDVHNDGGRILSKTPEPLLLPFLKAINHPPIDIKPVRILNENKSYSEIVLTQTLKEGLVALNQGNEKKISDINASLNTASYKAFCDEDITIPDFYKAILTGVDVTRCRSDETSITLNLTPHTTEYEDLIKCGLNLNTPGWTLTQNEVEGYELNLSDIDAKYSVEVNIRLLLSISNLYLALDPNIDFLDVLDYCHSIIPTPSGLISINDLPIEERRALVDPLLEGEVNIVPVTAENFVDLHGDNIGCGTLMGLIINLLEKENVSGAVIEYLTEGDDYYRQSNAYDEDPDAGDYLVLVFTHPFFPTDEFHVVIDDNVHDPYVPTTILKIARREHDHIKDFLVIADSIDTYEEAELPLLDVLHFMLSATIPPNITFFDS